MRCTSRVSSPRAEGSISQIPATVKRSGAQCGPLSSSTGPTGAPSLEVAGHGDVEQLRVRQVEVLHVADEVLLADRIRHPRVEPVLLVHAADGEATVVVRRVEQAVRGRVKIWSRIERKRARESPSWKSVRPVPLISRQSPVKAMRSHHPARA